MVLKAGHVGRLVNGSYLFVHLDQLNEYPESYLFVAVVHYGGHDKVHTLHVAYAVVVAYESLQDPLEPVVILVFDLDAIVILHHFSP